MDTFDCRGWIHITLSEGGDTALIRLKHEDDHVPYWSIDVPPEVQDYVHKNIHLSPIQVCIFLTINNHLTEVLLFCSFGMLFSKITESLHSLGSLFIISGMKNPASSGRRTQMSSNQRKFSLTRHQRRVPVPVQGVFIM
jgi:hypothetical protein